MSPQGIVTSTRQDKANWNSRRPLFLACARFGEASACLAQPAVACLIPGVQAAGSTKGHFLYPVLGHSGLKLQEPPGSPVPLCE